MPTDDPLAELRARHKLHNERHRMFEEPCHHENCQVARWLALCDRLAAAAAEREQERQDHRRATDEQIGLVARQGERLCLADAAAAEFRTALVFYADEANYDEETGAAGKWRRLPNTADDPGETVFEHDGGDAARAALLKDAGKNTLAEIGRLKDQVNRLCERFSDERDRLAAAERQRDKAAAQRDRLATDALTALSRAGIATPVEGYADAPTWLKGDIQQLAGERDQAAAALEQYGQHKSPCERTRREYLRFPNEFPQWKCSCGFAALAAPPATEGTN